MAFQLQKFKAYGVRTEGEVRKHVVQKVLMYIVAANTDVALDIGTLTTGSLGTFWTAVTGDATYGSLGSSALAVMQQVAAIAINGHTPELEGYTPVSATSTGKTYVTTYTSHVPIVALVSGSAPTGYYVTMEFDIPDGQEAVRSDLGAAS
jgi:hypothetical protein